MRHFTGDSWRVILDRLRRSAREDGELRAALRRAAVMLLADLERMEHRRPQGATTRNAASEDRAEPSAEPVEGERSARGDVSAPCADAGARVAPGIGPRAVEATATSAGDPTEAVAGDNVTSTASETSAGVAADSPRQPVALQLGGGGPIVLQVPVSSSELGGTGAMNADVAVRGTGERASRRPDATDARLARVDALDLSEVAARCQVKRDSCRFAVARQRRDSPGESPPTAEPALDYRSLIERAKSLPGCYLWALDPARSWALPEDAVLGDAEGNYEALAQAADLVGQLVAAPPEGGNLLADAFALLAEAQSGLRAVLEGLESPVEDRDQVDVHLWLRRQGEWRGIHLRRHMRRDDLATAGDWADRVKRVTELRTVWEGRCAREGERKRLLGKARYHAKRARRVARGETPHDHAPSQEEWGALSSAIDSLAAVGLAPDSREVRELILPLMDDLPPWELGAGMTAAIQRVIASGGGGEPGLTSSADADVDTAHPPERWRLPEVEQVARLLAGRAMVLVGGERREYTARAIERALGLSELAWLDAPEHESLSRLEPAVVRPEVALVAVIIKLSSHSFSELKDVCRRHGKAFVFLTHGYSANQIARAVLDQCSRVLEEQVGVGSERR